MAETEGADVELLTIGDRGSNRQVQALLDNVFPSPPSWTHTVVAGDIASGLARISVERQASMLLIGMKPGSQRHTTVEFARSANLPVLAVPTQMSEPPRRVLMALDFSQSSVRAAKVAFHLLARPARAFMVSASAGSVGEDPEPHIGLLFDTVENLLGAPRDVAITRHVVAGETPAALLRVAQSQLVDLIAVGRCGRSAATCGKPGAMGRVARAVVTSASCGVLLVPPPHLLQ